MADRQFKILSLDGGGIRGFFSAALLSQLESSTGKSIKDHFDLIAGTSTGAIIALGLASGMTATQILAFYEKHGRDIFSERRSLPRWLLRPKYQNAPLMAALRDIFGDRTLNDLGVPVCTTSYELVEGWTRVFKDDHHSNLHWGGERPIWKVAAASSAAPVYFPAVQIDQFDSHIDGGIWANNPVLIGIAEAVKFFDTPLEKISVLSLRTGSRTIRLKHAEAEFFGIYQWAKNVRLLNLVMEAQSKGAHNTASMLLQDGNYTRLDADLSESIPLDNYEAAQALIERGKQSGRVNKMRIAKKFLQDPREPLASTPFADEMEKGEGS